MTKATKAPAMKLATAKLIALLFVTAMTVVGIVAAVWYLQSPNLIWPRNIRETVETVVLAIVLVAQVIWTLKYEIESILTVARWIRRHREEC